ncbi:4-hydroxy-tetrahydrodipicolinate synthase [Metabacillus rhizolycopersici]|uniref:4-hydroxy-tetrahydrodipicolinate synthase n=1 Tax=Metabacillus rhizolycopersici TaxID=2875709 RepID=A0ABS7UNP9_9BACI|nr:4-hydroxy-tetrahydrodipicolinate synthase [Metabacillus rhizolycopersici]MBZ5749926.1 4-hydroxy-tetrahydrodipicolinate synthase [Metabacillus rhizolycopersici]
MSHFGKLSTAMVTPFDKNGNVDFQKTTTLIDYLINHGTQSLVVNGTTGESPTLSTEEKIALFKHTVKEVNGRIPVIAGTGSNNTAASIKLTKQAEEAGVDAIMLVVPYYNKPSQEGLYQHFKAIAETTTLPVMLYNIPGRSVINMTVDTIVRLSKLPNIIAVKEAGGNLDVMAELISKTDDNFAVYSGDDALALPLLAIGGAGVISVASHIIGSEMESMISAFVSGDQVRAAEQHRRLLPIMKQLFVAPNPVPVKTALQVRGLDVGSVRLPLIPLTSSERNELMEVINNSLR